MKFFPMRIFSKTRVIIALIIIGISLYIYNSFFSSNKTKLKESVQVTSGTLEDKLTISGHIEADEHVILRFQTSGKLAWVGVKEGDYVKKYQAVASLDKNELKKNLDKELNDYLKTRWDYDQAAKDTYKDKVITDTIKRAIDKTQFDLNNSVLDVEIQKLSVELANLWTPIEGLVIRVTNPYAGVNIISTSTEYEIVNPETVYFSSLADQNEVVKLKKDMSGELILDSYPDKTIIGSIKNISFTPKTGETGTVYEVKFSFIEDNSDYRLRLGMSGDVSFVTRKKENVLYLPVKFVKSDKEKKYALVKRNGKEEKISVNTGMETDNDIEITGGLTAGETVYD